MERSGDPRFSALLERLYGGLDADPPWSAFLQALAEWLDCAFSTLIITAPGRTRPGTFVTPGADGGFSRSYVERFFVDDPFRGLPEGRVTSFREFMAGHDPAQFAAYREFLREVGGEQVLGVDLRFPGQFEARFRVTRPEHRPDFTAEDRQRLQQLVPHLRNAVALYERLQFAGAQHAVFRKATEGLGLALLVLDRQRHPVSANALAERILAEGEGLRMAGGTVRFDSTVLRTRLDDLVKRGAGPGGVLRFRIPRPTHGDLVATARAIELPAIHSGTGALALFLARPGEEVMLDPQAIRELLGVTAAEARLCMALAQGDSLVGAAQRLGVAHNTAKAQLRSIFAKTQVHRQAQLVNLLGTLTG
jgi:DNA-binding CsgD family transcriptional regulator/PAS domain-containing protein